MLEAHEEERRERHDLPADQEEEGVRRQEHDRDRQQRRIVERAKNADVLPAVEPAHIAEGVKRKREADQRHEQHEEEPESIEADRELDVRDQRREQLDRLVRVRSAEGEAGDAARHARERSQRGERERGDGGGSFRPQAEQRGHDAGGVAGQRKLHQGQGQEVHGRQSVYRMRPAADRSPGSREPRGFWRLFQAQKGGGHRIVRKVRRASPHISLSLPTQKACAGSDRGSSWNRSMCGPKAKPPVRADGIRSQESCVRSQIRAVLPLAPMRPWRAVCSSTHDRLGPGAGVRVMHRG